MSQCSHLSNFAMNACSQCSSNLHSSYSITNDAGFKDIITKLNHNHFFLTIRYHSYLSNENDFFFFECQRREREREKQNLVEFHSISKKNTNEKNKINIYGIYQVKSGTIWNFRIYFRSILRLYASAREKKDLSAPFIFISFYLRSFGILKGKNEGFEEKDEQENKREQKKNNSVALDETFSPFSLTANPIDEKEDKQ